MKCQMVRTSKFRELQIVADTDDEFGDLDDLLAVLPDHAGAVWVADVTGADLPDGGYVVGFFFRFPLHPETTEAGR